MASQLCKLVSLLSLGLIFVSATVTSRDHDKDGRHSKEFDDDVMWGDENTSEDDDDVESLSHEERTNRLRLLVAGRIDKNKDGFVSLEELTDWAERSYDLFETEETKEMFPELDKDKDGAIKWAEYVSDSYGDDFSEDSEEFLKPQTPEWVEFVATYEKEKKKFDAADLDGNKELTLEEYQIFKHPRRHPETEKVLLEETLETSDLNKDGKIDVDEFLGDFLKREGESDPHWATVEREKFTAELDLDKDGFLVGVEILQWISPNNRALALEEAEHLMDVTDLNNDEKLTADEIVESHTDWVDSDATDYGRQLLKNHDEL